MSQPVTSERSTSEASVWRTRLRELFSIDTRSLGVFRVLMGVMLLLDLAKRSLSLSAH